MKIKYLLPLLFALTLHASAQSTEPDSLNRPLRGILVWTDFGLANASYQRVNDQLRALGLTQDGDVLSSFGLSSFRRYTRRLDAEARVWGIISDGSYDVVAPGWRMEGLGLGFLNTYRAVSTRRFTLGPGIGSDFWFYRLRLFSPAAGQSAVPIQSILVNPTAYRSTKLSASTLTLNLALTGGLKFGLFPRAYDHWQLTGRVGYYLPLVSSSQWRFDQNYVGGLDVYRPGGLYGSIGLIGFMRNEHRDRVRQRYR